MKKSWIIFLIVILVIGCTNGISEPQGFFVAGQDADLMLSGVDFNNTGGPLLFNHNGGIATDGMHLILADRNNNRILIWNTLPEGNEEPNIVLGQKDFYTNNPGNGSDELSWPIAVATDGTRLIVADTWNHRILIWNSFPTENGQAADIVLETPEKQVGGRGDLKWPWAVWTDGKKLVVTSTQAGQVFIWNEFPTENNQEPDVILANEDFGTPRSIASDGTHLAIGDHNARGTPSVPGGAKGTFFWNTFPTEDDQPYDFFVSNPAVMGIKQAPNVIGGEWMFGPTVTEDGKLLALTNIGLVIWNAFPESEDDAPDLVFSGSSVYDFGGRQSGDGSGVAVAGEKVFLSLANGNKVVVYNEIPTEISQKPDFALGSPDIDTNTFYSHYSITNGIIASNGKSLFIASGFDAKLSVWKHIPDESGTYPDMVYNLSMRPLDSDLFEDTFVIAGDKTVYIWEELPLDGQEPDRVYEERIGNVKLQNIDGVALDDKYFYLSDKTAKKVYVWEGIPKADDNPVFAFSMDDAPGMLSSDGTYLVVGAPDPSDHDIEVYRIADLSEESEPIILQGLGIFNSPAGVHIFGGQLFVSDTLNNHIYTWKDIEDAIVRKNPDVVLGEQVRTEKEILPQIGKNKLFWPTGIWFDGSYLWVSELKFSFRILRFSPQE